MKKNVLITLITVLSVSMFSLEAMQRRRVVVGRTPAQAFEEHRRIQQEFRALQTAAGLTTSDATVRSLVAISGRQGTQAQFNAARSALNKMLEKSVFTADNVTAINAKIAELRRLNPARWPQPADYQNLFNVKQAAAAARVAALPQPVR